MNILFIHIRPEHYDSDTVRNNPSGGTEKAFVFLGEALAKLGHDVSYITTKEQLTQPTVAPDVVITQEPELFQAFPKSKKIYWSHHFSNQPIVQRGAVWVRALADKVVTLSKCHHDDWLQNLRLGSVIIGHGVWLDEVATGVKDPYRLIYASTPFRGLERIPELFRAIKAKEPRATIAICSSMATYGTPEQDGQYRALFDELSSIDGVELLGSLNQYELYQQYARASAFFYPCTWPETYCIAMDEAIAHGCSPFVLNVGALNRINCAMDSEQEMMDGVLHDFSGAPCGGFESYARDWMAVARDWERLF